MVLPAQSAWLTPVFVALAALSMFVGNLLALVQNNSQTPHWPIWGIASAGYILMAFAPPMAPAGCSLIRWPPPSSICWPSR
jgi:NADH:ubiquinone oxidoreductase subunit 2 (subunit N)